MSEIEEKCCANCIYCVEIHNLGYEGGCNKHGFYLQTTDDRLCEGFIEKEAK